MNFMEKLKKENIEELTLFLENSAKTLEEVRRVQGILLLEEGLSAIVMKTITGLERKTVVKVRKKYIKYGVAVLISKRKEKKPASLLTKGQREAIYLMLQSKTPRDFGWDIDYWIPSVLGKLILELYRVKYKSKTSIRLLFKEAKFTYHKPEKVYKQRDQELIDKWRTEMAPIVNEAFNDDNTVVLVEDEMGISTQTTLQKIWLPQGAQPKIECSNTRKRRSIYGFLNIKTGEQIALKTERQTSEITASCLKKVLNRYKDKKVVLIWDNAPWHFGKPMRDFLNVCSKLIIYNFPPYAPDENPQEHIWKAARTNVTHNTYIADIDKAARQILGFLNSAIFKYEFFGFKAF